MNINMWKTLRSSKIFDVRYDDQQQYIAIIEAAIVSTTKENTSNSTMSIILSLYVNNHSAIKPKHILEHNLLFELCTGLILYKKIAQLWCKLSYLSVSLFKKYKLKSQYTIFPSKKGSQILRES